jgi:septal ring factor EnvC (AmiA/AmiB activator)
MHPFRLRIHSLSAFAAARGSEAAEAAEAAEAEATAAVRGRLGRREQSLRPRRRDLAGRVFGRTKL